MDDKVLDFTQSGFRIRPCYKPRSAKLYNSFNFMALHLKQGACSASKEEKTTQGRAENQTITHHRSKPSHYLSILGYKLINRQIQSFLGQHMLTSTYEWLITQILRPYQGAITLRPKCYCRLILGQSMLISTKYILYI